MVRRTFKGVGQKASAYSRLVSAPLTSRALAIAVAPWSPILLLNKLPPEESEQMVSRRSRDGQAMVKGGSSGSERSPQVGQRAVDLQGLADHGRTLVADLAVPETVTI